MKKRNVIIISAAAALLIAAAIVVPIVIVEGNKNGEEPVTMITQEIVDNTLNAMKKDFKGVFSIEGEFPSQAYEGMLERQKQELVERHHFDDDAEYIAEKVGASLEYVIDKEAFLSAEDQNQELLDELESSMFSDYEKKEEGNIITYSMSNDRPEEYSLSFNEYSHFFFDYDEDEDKYEKSLEFGSIKEDSIVYDFDIFLKWFVNKGTYDAETGCVVIDNDDLPANDLSSSYKVIFSLKVQNNLINEFSILETDDPDDIPYCEKVRLEFGAQSFTLPNEEDLIICVHQGGSSTSYYDEGNKLYAVTYCTDCWSATNIEEVTLDEEGKFEGHQVMNQCYVREFGHLISTISYNPITNKIVDIEFDCCYDSTYLYNYKYTKEGTTYTVYGRLYTFNDISVAYVKYEVGGVYYFTTLKDAVINNSEMTITGTVINEYYSGQVLDI